MTPSTDTIRRVAGSKTYARSQTYAQQGRASITERSDNGTRIKAQVRGTRPQPYRQNIPLKRAENRAIQGFDGSCTCPVGHNCKHVVAVLLQDLLDHPPERHGKQRGVRSGTLNITPAIADAAHAMRADQATAIRDNQVQAALHLSDSHAGSYAPAAHAHDGASDRATLNRNAGEASAMAYAVQHWLSGMHRLSQPPPSAQDMADAPQSLKERLAYAKRSTSGCRRS